MGAKREGFVEKVGVPVVIVIWYSCSVVGNNAGKVVLPLFPYPYTLSIIQFAIGSCAVPLAMALRGRPVDPLLTVPVRSKDRGMLLGLSGICSNLFQRVAIMFISVSFTHTVKASQPLFSAVLSWSLLGQRFSRASIASLFVISGGVALSAFTEFQFNIFGFFCALFSAFSMSVANTFQKRFMFKAKDLPRTIHGGTDVANSSHSIVDSSGRAAVSGAEATSLDKNELFFLTNVYSCALMLPLWWFIDGRRMFSSEVPAEAHLEEHQARTAPKVLSPYVLWMVVANTAPMVLQHFVSLAILSLLSPVSHSIVNSFKRIVVISLSVLYFHNPVSPLNAFGMVCALGGVFLYQRSLQQGGRRQVGVSKSGSWLDGLSSPTTSPVSSPSNRKHNPASLEEKGPRYEEP